MSLRPRASAPAPAAAPPAAPAIAAPSTPLASIAAPVPVAPSPDSARIDAALAFSALHPVEQAAASLGVHPDELKPIGFLNAGHYKELRTSQRLTEGFAEQIECYKTVAESSAAA